VSVRAHQVALVVASDDRQGVVGICMLGLRRHHALELLAGGGDLPHGLQHGTEKEPQGHVVRADLEVVAGVIDPHPETAGLDADAQQQGHDFVRVRALLHRGCEVLLGPGQVPHLGERLASRHELVGFALLLDLLDVVLHRGRRRRPARYGSRDRHHGRPSEQEPEWSGRHHRFLRPYLSCSLRSRFESQVM
jgi:hypothetical protein